MEWVCTRLVTRECSVGPGDPPPPPLELKMINNIILPNMLKDRIQSISQNKSVIFATIVRRLLYASIHFPDPTPSSTPTSGKAVHGTVYMYVIPIWSKTNKTLIVHHTYIRTQCRCRSLGEAADLKDTGARPPWDGLPISLPPNT